MGPAAVGGGGVGGGELVGESGEVEEYGRVEVEE